MTVEKIIELNGKCAAIDPTTQTFSIRDTTGAPHPFKWGDVLNDVMKKWKAGYYLTVRYNSDTREVKNVTYWQEGKDQFPKENKGGGRSFQPRNDRAIIVQCCFKEACETMRQMVPMLEEFDAAKYEEYMDIALARAISDAEKLCKSAGVP